MKSISDSRKKLDTSIRSFEQASADLHFLRLLLEELALRRKEDCLCCGWRLSLLRRNLSALSFESRNGCVEAVKFEVIRVTTISGSTNV